MKVIRDCMLELNHFNVNFASKSLVLRIALKITLNQEIKKYFHALSVTIKVQISVYLYNMYLQFTKVSMYEVELFLAINFYYQTNNKLILYLKIIRNCWEHSPV